MPVVKIFHLKATASKRLGAYWDPTPLRWPPEAFLLNIRERISSFQEGILRFEGDDFGLWMGGFMPVLGKSRPFS
jgi:hypothetical protein